MATTTDGLFLEQYVEPQLLEEFRNYNDAFLSVLGRPNPGAIDKDGIRFNKLINNVGGIMEVIHKNILTNFWRLYLSVKGNFYSVVTTMRL